jgi:hypothetical protein
MNIHLPRPTTERVKIAGKMGVERLRAQLETYTFQQQNVLLYAVGPKFVFWL